MQMSLSELQPYYRNSKLQVAVFGLLLLFVFVFSTSSFAATSVENDTITSEKPEKYPDPNKVLLRAALIPGWGQISNQQYIKLPFLYAGFGACYYFIRYHKKYYDMFRDAYRLRVDDDPSTLDIFDPSYDNHVIKFETADQLRSNREYYRRNFELMIIVTTGVYALNLIDAYVNAHLRNFDMSNDLSLQINPPIIYTFAHEKYAMLIVNLNF